MWRPGGVLVWSRRALVAAGVGVSAVLVVAGSGVASGSAESLVVVSASGDAYLRSGASDTNEGGAPFLRVRASGDNRGLVRFDEQALEQAVGSGQLVSAVLEFEITDNANNWGSEGRTISVYRLTTDWAEGNGFVSGNSPSDRVRAPG